ncbi:MAG: peptidoglycan DD-metalloendopeptidase family protein [Actinomycetota bacterium]
MKSLCVVVLGAVVALAPAPAAGAERPPLLIPPVDGSVGERFVAPSTSYGSGHRGIDYVVAEGVAVRAAAEGTVTFAGRVAGAFAVTIAHDGDLETTYSRLAEVYVSAGDFVDQGRWVGTVYESHAGADGGLHFGVKLHGAYVDPALFLGPLDVGAAIHLVPVVGVDYSDMPEPFDDLWPLSGNHREPCRDPAPLKAEVRPPSDNVAVAIAGITSSTAGDHDPVLYGPAGPAALGYPPGSIYRFSYRGANGPAFHEDYEARDTYGDLGAAAAKLRDLLARIHARHLGAGVDLIAHSQGGLIARAYLAGVAESWDPSLPHVENLVTLATPHRGAPLAGEVDDLEDHTATGGWLITGLSRLADAGAPIPDPRSVAVQQMAPGSSFLGWLAREDVTFGTRVLALSIPNDWLVPPDRARYEGKVNRVVAPAGISGHNSIVYSTAAREFAYAWLRGAPVPCEGTWDLWGPRMGAVVEWGEGALDWVVGRAEWPF